MKRHKPMRRQSSKRAAEMALYRKERDEWLKDHQQCVATPRVKGPCSPLIDLHHYRGRIGALLRDQRFWRPVCRIHHNWIGDHKKEARELDLLANALDFDTVPKGV